MNKKLLLLILTFSIFTFNAFAQSLLPPSVNVQLLVEDWCSGGTGSLDAQTFGGTPPYTYQWSMGANTEIVNGLMAGNYDVTVTDNLGVTVSGSGFVNSIYAPEFYAISIEMPRQGLNNGSVTVAIYPDNGSGGAQQLPDGIYQYELHDSIGAIVESYSFFIPGTFDPYYYFDSLPAGNYSVYCYIIGLGCSTYNNFTLKEMPDINPTYTSLPSCNGSPTGQIVINSHPSPVIDANTFNSNQNSNLFVWEAVSSRYKAIVYDSNSLVVKYSTTQDSLFTISGMLPGNYTLKIYGGDTIETFYPGSHDSTLFYSGNFTIVNDTLCSLVKGRAFVDYNNNCSYNAGDIVLAGTLIELNPGGLSAVTNSTGEFYIPVPVGIYTLKQYAPYQYAQLCPDTNTFNINVSSTGLIIDVQLADSINVNPDVQIGLYASQPRPGFNQYLTVTYKNLTPNIIPAAQTLTLNYDTNLVYVNANPVFSSSSLGQLSWASPVLGPFSQATYQVTLNIPATVSIGTQLNTTAFVTNVAGESNTANNSDSISQTVTGSYDPNDIAVNPTGYGAQGYITNFENLKYTIRFQNTGNDTAFTVVVADTLPATLNKYSLQILSSSHPYWYEFKNPNVVLFHFDNILLPDSNVNEEASHGFIKFAIAQTPGNVAGNVIQNSAGIYFDFNTPVITNTVSNTIYNCNQMAAVNFNNQTICDGDSVIASASLLFEMNTNWSVDGIFYSSDSIVTFLNLSAGIHQVDMIASNNVCDQQVTANITVNPLPIKPTFNINFNLLTSSSAFGNQWFLDGNLISGASDSTYIALANGWYSVMVTDANGCSNLSDSVFILVGGIADLQGKNVFKLKPNPATDEVEITGLKLEVGDEIFITNALGKISSKTKIERTKVTYSINVSGFQPGIYFVNIINANTISTLKMIKL